MFHLRRTGEYSACQYWAFNHFSKQRTFFQCCFKEEQSQSNVMRILQSLSVCPHLSRSVIYSDLGIKAMRAERYPPSLQQEAAQLYSCTTALILPSARSIVKPRDHFDRSRRLATSLENGCLCRGCMQTDKNPPDLGCSFYSKLGWQREWSAACFCMRVCTRVACG